MSDDAPRLDTRRTAEFVAELQERARAWIPGWGFADSEGDFGRALLEIAARFNSEVAERLDGAGDKMRRGFLDWLAVRGEAARPARMPVVFRLADAARTSVLGEAPVRLQVDANGTPVVFETERDVRIVPGRVEALVAVDAADDAFYLAPPGLTSLEPVEPAPTRWQPKNFVAAGETKFQLDPEGGLAEGTVIEAAGRQYRVVTAEKDLVTITPPLDTELSTDTVVTKAERLAPFDGVARNWQAHALYLGDPELLNIEAAATIEVVGAGALKTGVTWQYWGKVEDGDAVTWQSLELAEDQPANGVRLSKRKGAVEIKDIAGKSARWIRAYRPKSDAVVAADEFGIRINSEGCAAAGTCPPSGEYVSPAAEGMANTTPLVLENIFFPLGREPRQFDAFYLGSKEVFSKPKAKVKLCFEVAVPRFKVLGALKTAPMPNQFLAGVGGDGHLHLLKVEATGAIAHFPNRDALRPPSPASGGAPGAGGTPVPLDPNPSYRPPVWATGSDVFTAVAAQNAVWVWREDTLTPANSGWISLGTVVPEGDATKPITGLVHLSDGPEQRLYALRDSTLYVRDLQASSSDWNVIRTFRGSNTDVSLVTIAPIASEAKALAGDLVEGLLGTSGPPDGSGFVYRVDTRVTEGKCTEVLDSVASDIAPAGARRADGSRVVVAVGRRQADRTIRARLTDPNAADSTVSAKLETEEIVGHAVDMNLVAGKLTFAVGLDKGVQQKEIATWTPFATPPDLVLRAYSVPASAGMPAGVPTLLSNLLLVPTDANEVIVASYNPQVRDFEGTPESVLITATGADRLEAGSHVAFSVDDAAGPKWILEPVPAADEFRGRRFHRFAESALEDVVHVFKKDLNEFVGSTTLADLDELTLAADDVAGGITKVGHVLRITTSATEPYYVKKVDAGVATLDRDLNVNTGNPLPPIDYQVPVDSGARLRPLLVLDAQNRGWDENVLDRSRLQFPGGDPEQQVGVAFKRDANGDPELVALQEFWETSPQVNNGKIAFKVDLSIGEWSRQLSDSSTNPELSWEYWNGTGWWTLGAIDNTSHLKRTGTVTFDVPADLRETDWSGKSNFWIRARLIGGDYGQQKVTVRTETLPDGKTTEQTVLRSTDGVRAPSVLKLYISYALCEITRPLFLLSEDSGTIRDQSDANRTPGAIVEAFVPISVMLARLAGGATPAAQASDEGDCGCGKEHSPGAAATAAPSAAASSGRALFVGVTAPLTGAPINLLFLVDERKHGELAPLTTEAFIADRFDRIVANDGTRALGESGVLSMSFPEAPTERELFGRTLTWLKLSPRSSTTTAEWKPSIRGAYLNAVWAAATETLTRELLGSSDGAPFLTFRLARPPVLRDTLELRVREPLSDEERIELREEDPTKIRSDVEGLPGDWVRWDRVIDPGDEPPTQRGYAFDETIGEVRFGDGLHGMIPPIGRDSIVAFSYQRTEAGPTPTDIVPANSIAARTPLNLVTPVESVEAVIAADQAAGGAPPESVDRVVRFGFSRLRHRSRVVTARDLEDIALQSSPDIAQARAFPTRTGMKLIVVMKGKTPQPTAAQVRELRRVLLAASPASLAEPGALRIAGPIVRSLRVELTLRVETLDKAGRVAEGVKEKLAKFFDTATGGLDRRGWPLGANPSEDDIALALADVADLDGIVEISLRETRADASVQQWQEAIPATHVAMLAEDPVRLEFETAEVLA